MKKNSEYNRFLLIGACLIFILYFFPSVVPSKFYFGVNDISAEYAYFLSKKSVKPPKIVGVTIDDYSLDKFSQRWPWRRNLYAQAIKILNEEKANTVGIDIAFVGESENKEDDDVFAETLNNVDSRVVLAYFFDYKNASIILPLDKLKSAAYMIGMVNTPQDSDGKSRRMRSLVELNDAAHYSFAVMLSSSFLNQKPQDVISDIPLLRDKTFFINYILKPKDIIRVSFYDILENLEALKQENGKDFLKGALVLIYPEAEIIHDTHFTPLGKMPGGILNLNACANIILKHFIKEQNLLSIVFLALSLGLIFYILELCGFIFGLIFTLGVVFVNFWFLILLNLKGIKFDYSRVVIFCLLFFISGSFYKYAYFLTQLLKIKDRATIDPLRGLFTLRYFYYRMELELKKIYFQKDAFLVFLYLGQFREGAEGVPLEKVKKLWQEIALNLSLKRSFWAVYSQEELTGCIVSSQAKIGLITSSLKNNLDALIRESGIKSKVKLGYLKLKREYPVRELLYIVSDELKKREADTVLFKDSDLVNLLGARRSGLKESNRLLDSIDEDIADKNRELLSLIENLNKEHLKTKEAFFQIITSLVNALEARDPYTEGHSERVCNYAMVMAEKLGWREEQKEKLRKAALLHDIGKIGIPDSILHKKDRLNDDEYNFIKKHEIMGVKILEPLKEINDIMPWIMYHHERWDGKGYPHGLAGDTIPLASQIIAICDTFDALTSSRDYRIALAQDEAIKEIVKNKGIQFNPQLVDVFVSAISDKITRPQK